MKSLLLLPFKLGLAVYILTSCQPLWASKCGWRLNDIAQVKREETHILSNFGTTAIETVDGHKYVLREGSEDEVRRSIFNSQFINRVLGHNANPVRRLAKREEQVAKKILRSESSSWTIEPFLDGERGYEYLQDHGLSNGLISFLFGVREVDKAQTTHGYKEYVIYELIHWPDEKVTALADAIETQFGIKPPLEKRFLNQWIVDTLCERLQKGSLEEAFKTVKLVLETGLQEKQIQMLSDLWILATVLGIHDFHPKNWILEDDTIVAIDLNEISYNLPDESPINLMGHKHPFGFTEVTEFSRQFMIKNMSQGLRDFLSAQSLESLKSLRQKFLGRNSHYSEIEDLDLRKMLRRIAYILSNSPNSP